VLHIGPSFTDQLRIRDGAVTLYDQCCISCLIQYDRVVWALSNPGLQVPSCLSHQLNVLLSFFYFSSCCSSIFRDVIIGYVRIVVD
jgi:hypothetical protein